MSKFKAGDKAFHFPTGIVKIDSVENNKYSYYPVQILLKNGAMECYSLNGLYHCSHSRPLLYTLKEALEKGFITQEQYNREMNS